MSSCWRSIALVVALSSGAVGCGPSAPQPGELSLVASGVRRLDLRFELVEGHSAYRSYVDGLVHADHEFEERGSFPVRRLMPDRGYEVCVVTLGAFGGESEPSCLTANTEPRPALVAELKFDAVRVTYPDTIDPAHDEESLTELMYGGDGSVRAYFERESYGRTTIVGEVHDLVLPGSAADYHLGGPAGDRWVEPDFEKIQPLVEDALGPRLDEIDVMALFLEGSVGIPGGAKSQGMTKWLPAIASQRVLIHELTHDLSRPLGMANIGHAGSWRCDRLLLPRDLSNLEADRCLFEEYGDFFDPMGSSPPLRASDAEEPEPHGLHSFSRWLLGFLPDDNVLELEEDATVTLHRLEGSASGVQMILVPLPEENAALFVEYRRPDGDAETNPLARGAVLVRLIPPIGSELNVDTIVPRYLGELPVEFTPEFAFYDAHRRLVVEVLELNEETAEVRVGFDADRPVSCRCSRVSPTAGGAGLAGALVAALLVAWRLRRRRL